MEWYTNQVANFCLANGFKRGDTVALLMDNRPEYVGIWYDIKIMKQILVSNIMS